MVNLNLSGRSSKNANVLSSLAVTTLKGLTGEKSHELSDLDWPIISPTEDPISALNIAPNLKITFIKRQMRINKDLTCSRTLSSASLVTPTCLRTCVQKCYTLQIYDV